MSSASTRISFGNYANTIADGNDIARPSAPIILIMKNSDDLFFKNVSSTTCHFPHSGMIDKVNFCQYFVLSLLRQELRMQLYNIFLRGDLRCLFVRQSAIIAL